MRVFGVYKVRKVSTRRFWSQRTDGEKTLKTESNMIEMQLRVTLIQSDREANRSSAGGRREKKIEKEYELIRYTACLPHTTMSIA